MGGMGDILIELERRGDKLLREIGLCVREEIILKIGFAVCDSTTCNM